MSASLPSQLQQPTVDSVAEIIGFRSPNSHELILKTIQIRKRFLYPIVEPLGKRFQVFRVAEPRISQLLWLWLSNRSVGAMLERTLYHRRCPHCHNLSPLDQA